MKSKAIYQCLLPAFVILFGVQQLPAQGQPVEKVREIRDAIRSKVDELLAGFWNASAALGS